MPRVEAAAAIHGIEPLRRIANQIKTLPDCPQRSARIDELMKMIGDRAIDEQANEILTRLQNGQRPSVAKRGSLRQAKRFTRVVNKSSPAQFPRTASGPTTTTVYVTLPGTRNVIARNAMGMGMANRLSRVRLAYRAPKRL